tara:strand:+ start:9650 stop:10495 length:846 start_codon:yes stop_codon:yes gene_type:complete
MAKNKRGLGRGLDALFEEKPNNTKESKNINVVSIENLERNPFQPRIEFEKETLSDLTESIKERGIIQPIVVRKKNDKDNLWQIIAGERRWRAAQKAGLKKVPVFIKDINDEQAATIALIENIQREDLTALEEAQGFKNLIEKFSITQEELSKKLGKSRTYIANYLRLLALPKNVKNLLQSKKISVGQVRPIIGHKDASELANKILLNNLNSRQVEKLVRDHKNKKVIQINYKDPNISDLEKQLEGILGLKIKIIDRNGTGKISFIYKNLDQLEHLLKKIRK